SAVVPQCALPAVCVLSQPHFSACPPPEPVDRPPVLLIANSQNILATYLSGAPVPNITPTSAKQTTAMDFNYIEDTVCWVHVGDSASQTILKCAKIPNLKGFVEERSINISLSLHRECSPCCASGRAPPAWLPSCMAPLLHGSPPPSPFWLFPSSSPLVISGERCGFFAQIHTEGNGSVGLGWVPAWCYGGSSSPHFLFSFWPRVPLASFPTPSGDCVNPDPKCAPSGGRESEGGGGLVWWAAARPPIGVCCSQPAALLGFLCSALRWEMERRGRREPTGSQQSAAIPPTPPFGLPVCAHVVQAAGMDGAVCIYRVRPHPPLPQPEIKQEGPSCASHPQLGALSSASLCSVLPCSSVGSLRSVRQRG
ncbi:hypothetical protein CIB84_017281, partial [Bambusicola thoracicus]